MSFDHQAFRFQWNAFATELSPILSRVLQEENSQALERFIDDNLISCVNPYDGEALDEHWRDALETGDVQEVADFALTRYYSPLDDVGLGGAWLPLSESLKPAQQAALLGSAFGSAGRKFDPGRQGSYFQSSAQLRESTAVLAGVTHPEVVRFRQIIAG